MVGRAVGWTQLKHVIHLERHWNPAKEAQAFGRVDRIGQTKRTYVHRFIVKRTVEEKVYMLAQQRASTYSVMGVPAARKGKEESHLTIRDIKDLLNWR